MILVYFCVKFKTNLSSFYIQINHNYKPDNDYEIRKSFSRLEYSLSVLLDMFKNLSSNDKISKNIF